MNIQNLSTDEVSCLQDIIEDMKQTNPNITYDVYKMEDDKPDIQSKLIALEEKIDKIEKKIDMIFGNHILLGGEWKIL